MLSALYDEQGAPVSLAELHEATCVEPVGESCLTYAYALYDLGRALALIGHRAEAVSVLERRLQIDNQRATVAAELERACAQAG